MDLERTLEIQRVKLLRLLAGWIAALGVLSLGPLALPVPRWIRAFFDSVLIRAELAVHYLLRASASMQAQSGLIDPPAMPRVCSEQAVDVPTTSALLRRMEALCDVLENLPRSARQLLRVRIIAGKALDWAQPSHSTEMRDRLDVVGTDWLLPRIERPPDKRSAFSGQAQ